MPATQFPTHREKLREETYATRFILITCPIIVNIVTLVYTAFISDENELMNHENLLKRLGAEARHMFHESFFMILVLIARFDVTPWLKGDLITQYLQVRSRIARQNVGVVFRVSRHFGLGARGF